MTWLFGKWQFHRNQIVDGIEESRTKFSSIDDTDSTPISIRLLLGSHLPSPDWYFVRFFFFFYTLSSLRSADDNSSHWLLVVDRAHRSDSTTQILCLSCWPGLEQKKKGERIERRRRRRRALYTTRWRLTIGHSFFPFSSSEGLAHMRE